MRNEHDLAIGDICTIRDNSQACKYVNGELVEHDFRYNYNSWHLVQIYAFGGNLPITPFPLIVKDRFNDVIVLDLYTNEVVYTSTKFLKYHSHATPYYSPVAPPPEPVSVNNDTKPKTMKIEEKQTVVEKIVKTTSTDYVITLSKEELLALAAVCGKIGGSGPERSLYSAIYRKGEEVYGERDYYGYTFLNSKYVKKLIGNLTLNKD
jgi:hypothetical protein